MIVYPVSSRVFARVVAKSGTPSKLAALYRPGTVVVSHRNGGHVVRLDGDKRFQSTEVRRNYTDLKPCFFNANEVAWQQDVAEEDEDTEYAVDHIVNIRKVLDRRNQPHYQVKVYWSGYAPDVAVSDWMPLDYINESGLSTLLNDHLQRCPSDEVIIREVRQKKDLEELLGEQLN